MRLRLRHDPARSVPALLTGAPVRAVGVAASFVLTAVSLLSAGPVSAQLAATASVTSDYRYRGVDISEARPAASVDLAYDTAGGAYAGGSLIAANAPDEGPRIVGLLADVGYARRAAGGLTLDAGVSHASFFRYAYGVQSSETTEVYAGLIRGPLRAYLYYAPHYFIPGLKTLYLSVDGSLRPARRLRLFTHVGVLDAVSAPIRRGPRRALRRPRGCRRPAWRRRDPACLDDAGRATPPAHRARRRAGQPWCSERAGSSEGGIFHLAFERSAPGPPFTVGADAPRTANMAEATTMRGLGASSIRSIMAAGASVLALQGAAAMADDFNVVNLVSDGFVPAATIDPALINPWGISYGPTGPFWVSDNNAGVSTLYNTAGAKQAPDGRRAESRRRRGRYAHRPGVQRRRRLQRERAEARRGLPSSSSPPRTARFPAGRRP